MADVNRALVVGAGICGLGTGLGLARTGVQTTVLEIKADPNVLGVGINQPGNSLRAMRTLGIFDEVCESTVIRKASRSGTAPRSSVWLRSMGARTSRSPTAAKRCMTWS